MHLKYNSSNFEYPVIGYKEAQIDLIDIKERTNWNKLSKIIEQNLADNISDKELRPYIALLIIAYNFENGDIKNSFNIAKNEDSPAGEDYRLFVRNKFETLEFSILNNLHKSLNNSIDKKEFLVKEGSLLKKERRDRSRSDTTNYSSGLV